MRQDAHDWNENHDFFQYTAGRFLFAEADQIARRCVKFDMNELANISARSVDSKSCVAVHKLPEGQYSKAFLMIMDDGKRAIAKVPNPNAGQPHYTTASEVATMDFVRTTLQVPVPKVYAWDSKASENSVGAEFIIMEEARGIPLSGKWESLPGEEKLELVEKIVEIEKTLASTSFREIGSLYYTEDLEHPARKETLYTDVTGRPMANDRFHIGPTTDRKSFDDGRADIDFDRGPCERCTFLEAQTAINAFLGSNAERYITSIGNREIQCVRRIKQLPRPLGVVNGPGLYATSRESKLSLLDDYMKVASYLLPIDNAVLSNCLWHSDLHIDNMFIDSENLTEITCIIDWQSAHIEPILMQARHPSFLDFEGPKPEGYQAPTLPADFDAMSEGEQKRAKSLLSQQALYKSYEILSIQRNEKAYHALRHQKSLGFQIIALVSNLLQDGEPLVKAQLLQLQRDWEKVPGVRARDYPPCPLDFTSQDAVAQEVEQAKWMQGLELMDQILESLGTVDKGWHGWVKSEEYTMFKKRLDEVREDFLDDLSENAEDRQIWLSAWPFKD